MTVAENGANMVLHPIGYVRNEVDVAKRDGWEEVVSEIVLNPGLEEAVEGLEEFSHIMVIFWMHRARHGMDVPMRLHPRGRQDLPLVGLFATHAPSRPNPVGVSVVQLMECRGNVLKVKGLDAINGTPVIDLKSHFPKDVNATVPQWVTKLWTKPS